MTDHDPHVSDLRWDRLLAGDLPDDDRAAALAHASSCQRCAARRHALEADYAAFARRDVSGATTRARDVATTPTTKAAIESAAAPLESSAIARARDIAAHGPAAGQPVVGDAATRATDTSARDDVGAARARRARATWIASIGAVAAAAVVVLLATRSGGEKDGERSKGNTAPALALTVERAGRLVPLQAGDVLHPDDRVQATYAAKTDGYGAVLSRDGAGAASAYVPSAGDAMVRLPAGTDASFPESTILDDVTGTERIAIVWCREAQPIAPLLAALRAGTPVVAPVGCTVRELALAKAAP